MENQEYNDFDIAAMSEAVKMSGTALTQGQQPSGGPFGAAIYKNGKLIAASYNHVLSDNDPSAHGEVYTIREACKALNTWDLSEIAPNGQFTIHMGFVRLRALYQLRALSDVSDDQQVGQHRQNLFCSNAKRRGGNRFPG